MSVPPKPAETRQAGMAAEQPLRVDMIGLDTSHAPAFTEHFLELESRLQPALLDAKKKLNHAMRP